MSDGDTSRLTDPTPPADAASGAVRATTTDAPKIFGIGLSKTGTTSLANALGILGYRVKDNLGVTRYVAGDLSLSIDRAVLDANDAFTDTPIPNFYRELDARYPGSKFILTVRDADGWLKSCKKQFNAIHAEKQNEAHRRLFMDLYDCTVFDSEKFTSGYEKFVTSVRAHFAGRPQDLLLMDIAGGDGWETLCPFLGKPRPDVPFPKANVTRIRWIDIREVVEIAQRAGQEIIACLDRRRAKRPPRNTPASTVWLRARTLLYGKELSPLVEARKAAHGLIVEGLRKLDPRIPVLSPEGPLPPYAERKTWNHLWLIDPLQIEDRTAESAEALAVCIALIEDRKPIYGVVYVPRRNVAYFARAGKGSYCIDGGRAPVRLPKRCSVISEMTNGGRATDLPTDTVHKSASRTLALCALAEGKDSARNFPDRSFEWETAAADAVLRETGFRFCICGSGKELEYNKPDFVNWGIDVV